MSSGKGGGEEESCPKGTASCPVQDRQLPDQGTGHFCRRNRGRMAGLDRGITARFYSLDLWKLKPKRCHCDRGPKCRLCLESSATCRPLIEFWRTTGTKKPEIGCARRP